MAHLGADVAGFVDGQLSDAAMQAARTHLESCDVCDKAVRQQRLLKSRMSTVATPEPPAALLASLAGLATDPPSRERWWSRIGRSVSFRAGVAVVTASLAVLTTAYVVGGADPRSAETVSPPFNQYAADFAGPPTVQASNVIADRTLDDLQGFGWSCHKTLGGSFHRVSGEFVDDHEVISITYTDGLARLNLFERAGALSRNGLDGFESTQMAGSEVWIRPGSPTVVTWDDGGTVFTIVTDLGRDELESIVADLPKATPARGVGSRVGDGITRMTSWINAA